MTKTANLWRWLPWHSRAPVGCDAGLDAASSAAGQVAAPSKVWSQEYDTVRPAEHCEDDLIELDYSYAGMFRLHEKCHRGLLDEIGKLTSADKRRTLLEVAPGTGWNTGALRDAGFEYWALDISETALAVLLRRFPDARVINCEIAETGFMADGAFDIVFCSSLLEHISDHASTLKELVRLARSDLYVMFYEGLSTEEPDRFQHFPFDNPLWRRIFGRKFADYQDRHDGFFMKRFSQGAIEHIVKNLDVEYEFLDATNRPYLVCETVLHVRKHFK
jgi:ubiquinone/menaquinone biosynthesis C-methylase UbiE